MNEILDKYDDANIELDLLKTISNNDPECQLKVSNECLKNIITRHGLNKRISLEQLSESVWDKLIESISKQKDESYERMASFKKIMDVTVKNINNEIYNPNKLSKGNFENKIVFDFDNDMSDMDVDIACSFYELPEYKVVLDINKSFTDKLSKVKDVKNLSIEALKDMSENADAIDDAFFKKYGDKFEKLTGIDFDSDYSESFIENYNLNAYYDTRANRIYIENNSDNAVEGEIRAYTLSEQKNLQKEIQNSVSKLSKVLSDKGLVSIYDDLLSSISVLRQIGELKSEYIDHIANTPIKRTGLSAVAGGLVGYGAGKMLGKDSNIDAEKSLLKVAGAGTGVFAGLLANSLYSYMKTSTDIMKNKEFNKKINVISNIIKYLFEINTCFNDILITEYIIFLSYVQRLIALS